MKYNIGDVVIVKYNEEEHYAIIISDHMSKYGISYQVVIQGNKATFWVSEEGIVRKVE